MTLTFESWGAELSECGRYRYKLWRIWDQETPPVMFLMLNPSTADANKDDPTEKVPDNGMLGRVATNWPTPNATDGTKAPKHYDRGPENPSLPSAAASSPLGQRKQKPGHTCSAKCRRLNPLFVERLMGWPDGWTLLPTGLRDSAYLATEWSRWWRLMRSALSRLGPQELGDDQKVTV